MEPITIDLSPVINLTDEQFYHLAVSQPNGIKLERTPNGEIIIVTPHGAETSNRNIKILAQLETWGEKIRYKLDNLQEGSNPEVQSVYKHVQGCPVCTGSMLGADQNEDLGLAFDSDTEFKLPNGGNRSPDAVWVSRERWLALSDQERRAFPPICPDFVIELRSPTDRLKPLQDKMQEYLDSGLRLGWLINQQDKLVEIYRQGRAKEVLQQPQTLSGEDVLPGFVLQLGKIWLN